MKVWNTYYRPLIIIKIKLNMSFLTLSNKDNVAFKEPSGLPNGKQYLGKSTHYSRNQNLQIYYYYSINISGFIHTFSHMYGIVLN
jgi:hypothetical protein